MSSVRKYTLLPHPNPAMLVVTSIQRCQSALLQDAGRACADS
jgi:hypothetical protein